MKWMITVPKKVANMIIRGEQKVYICKTMKDLVYKDDIFFMCEKDSGGKVVGMFIISGRLCDSPNAFWNNYGQFLGWTEMEFFKFCGGDKMVQGVRISQAVAADRSYTISDFGLSQPPTEMVYIS